MIIDTSSTHNFFCFDWLYVNEKVRFQSYSLFLFPTLRKPGIPVSNSAINDNAKAAIRRWLRAYPDIDPVFLENLKNWFWERIRSHFDEEAFSAELQAGAEAKAKIPWLSKVFMKLTTAIKVGSTYKDELRNESRRVDHRSD